MSRMRLAVFLLLPAILSLRAVPGISAETGIVGLVVDGAGKPVPGAEVAVFSPQDFPCSCDLLVLPAKIALPVAPVLETRTDAGGRFRLSPLGHGTAYFLRARRSGFAPEVQTASTLPGGGEPAPLRLVLRPGVIATGRVVDAGGHPVAGMRVQLLRTLFDETGPGLADAEPYEALSGPDGRFEIAHVPAAGFSLRVAWRNFTVLAEEGLEIRRIQGKVDLGRLVLPKWKPLKGVVTDPSGRPVAGAEVWVGGAEDLETLGLRFQDREAGPSALTGADGGFEIPYVPAGHELAVCRPGFLPEPPFYSFSASEQIVLRPAHPRSRVSGRMADKECASLSKEIWDPCERRKACTPAALSSGKDHRQADLHEVRGRVTGPGGEAVGGALVSARPPYPTDATTYTAADGTFRLILPPPDRPDYYSRIEVRKPGYAVRSTPLHLAGRSTKGLEIQLEPGLTLTGYVLGANTVESPPVVMASQDQLSLDTPVRHDGSYRLEGLGPGEWKITVIGLDDRTAHVTLEPGQMETRLDLEAPVQR